VNDTVVATTSALAFSVPATPFSLYAIKVRLCFFSMVDAVALLILGGAAGSMQLSTVWAIKCYHGPNTCRWYLKQANDVPITLHFPVVEPDPFFNFVLTEATASAATFSFEALALHGYLDGYELQYRLPNGTSSTAFQGTATSTGLSNLSALTTYEARIGVRNTAFTALVFGEWLAFVTAHPLPVCYVSLRQCADLITLARMARSGATSLPILWPLLWRFQLPTYFNLIKCS
jgi:hypothetical protein